MPARKRSVGSTSSSTKPKRETKKPATFVPGATATITKARKRVVPKAKATPKSTKKAIPKRTPKARAKPTANKTKPKNAPKKAPKSTPKKPTATKKVATKAGSTKKAAARRSTNRGQPKYSEMIIEGIKSLRKKNGSSRQALEKYVELHYPQRPESKKWVRLTLSKLSKDGVIQKIRASYRLTPKNRSTSVPTKVKTATKKTPKAKAKAVKAPRATKKKTTQTTPASAPSSTTTPAESSGQSIWQYQHNGWKNYEPEASALVEVQYQEWLNNNQMFDVRSVKSGSWEYNVDFRRMVQINIQHPDHTERNIRRHAQ